MSEIEQLRRNLHEECAASANTIKLLQERLKAKDKALALARGETMECKGCKRFYENVAYGFYQYERVLKNGTVVAWTQQPCKMCISKRRRDRYLINKEKSKKLRK
jgi:hypothetical protein